MANREETLVLFDVDGTLSISRQRAKPEMMDLLLKKLKEKATVGIVSGSDLSKVAEQLGENCTKEFDYVFPENGTVAYHNGSLIGKESIAEFLGEDNVTKFTNFCLKYMSELTGFVKRGVFIEHRHGLINICPCGRSVSQQQRDAFGELDKELNIRKDFVVALNKQFPDLGLQYVIGGQISIDAFPTGWDKRYCLKFIENKFTTIHFYGDKTAEGGNDFHIFNDSRTIGHTVKNPEDTMAQLKNTFNL